MCGLALSQADETSFIARAIIVKMRSRTAHIGSVKNKKSNIFVRIEWEPRLSGFILIG